MEALQLYSNVEVFHGIAQVLVDGLAFVDYLYEIRKAKYFQ